MKVFICWSGKRSRIVAEGLREWLPSVFQDLEPWISETDVDKGSAWRAELQSSLDDSRFGIVCVTPENLSSRWLLFEAGALSKSQPEGEARVCTYLIGVDKSDVEDPLGQFQSTTSNREDTLQLLETINRLRGDPLEKGRLQSTFAKWWPDLEEVLEEAKSVEGSDSSQHRPDRELLEDILEGVRRVERSITRGRATGGSEALARRRRAVLKESLPDWISEILPVLAENPEFQSLGVTDLGGTVTSEWYQPTVTLQEGTTYQLEPINYDDLLMFATGTGDPPAEIFESLLLGKIATELAHEKR